MPAHRIRLRGPWDCEPLLRIGSAAALPRPCRMNLPCRWDEGGLANFAGRVRYRRRFGLPTNLDAGESVWLSFAAVDAAADVWLNSQHVGSHVGEGAFEFEVTKLLQPRNELVVEVESASTSGGLCGEVALEIRPLT
jgi:beta-galactosidase/beta-glucuronidase